MTRLSHGSRAAHRGLSPVPVDINIKFGILCEKAYRQTCRTAASTAFYSAVGHSEANPLPPAMLTQGSLSSGPRAFPAPRNRCEGRSSVAHELQSQSTSLPLSCTLWRIKYFIFSILASLL